MRPDPAFVAYPGRRLFVLAVLSLLTLALLGRALGLVLVDGEFLLTQGDARALRTVAVPTHRGMILDRNGVLIAGNEQNYRVVITREDAGDERGHSQRLFRVRPVSTSRPTPPASSPASEKPSHQPGEAGNSRSLR